MNIRKEHDYSALFAGIDQVIRAELSQMELYCELGRLICVRSEKGAAVAAATYLAEKYPHQTGFSARNVRRMRDFYRMYENVPDLLAQAMRLGWTQNVVILEANLTLEERAWYLQATEQFGWSKLTLQKKIAEAAHWEESIDSVPEICYNTHTMQSSLPLCPTEQDELCAMALYWMSQVDNHRFDYITSACKSESGNLQHIVWQRYMGREPPEKMLLFCCSSQWQKGFANIEHFQ